MKKGFTLIETVISIAIIAILGTAIISANINLNISRKKVNEISDINNAMQNTMEMVSAQIKRGNSYEAPSNIDVYVVDLSDKLVEITVKSGEKYELKKIVQKGIYPN